MNQEHISHQKQIQTFGDIVAEDNARVIIKQVNTTYQFIHRKDIQERNLIEASPYVGLKKFETKDRDLFFGRELWISKLIGKIGTSHLILLLGASGSGKSSLIRAGLIPKLTQLLRNPFVSLILTPDRNPFESFRATLISQGYSQEATETLLECKGNSFTNTVKNLKTIEEQWLIYIDQFEELFTQCKNTEIQKKFIQNITQITQKEENSIKIIIAMRADFLDQLSSSHPSLTKNPLFLHDMQPDELRLAIEQPAAKHGVVFEEGLIQQIINDVQGQARLQPGSLPLLQYTLDLLWQRSTKDISNHRILRKETYQVGGTVRDTLQKRVEEIYTNFTSDEKTATKQIFVKLVDPENTEKLSNLSSPAISRRAFLSEFTNELQQKTLKKLVDKNLLVTNQLNHQTQPTVEIAHEILINSWSTLKGWINERREVIILRNRLADDAQRWHDLYVQHQMLKAEDELWGGSKLERIVEFKQEQQLNSLFGGFSQEQENFFKASLEQRNRVRRKEARDKLLRSIGIGTIVLAGIATASAFLFANSQQNTNKSLQLANASATNLTLDPTRSLWLAIAAYIIKDTPQSYLAIGNALQVNYERVQLVGHTDKVLYAEFDPNNSQRVLTVSSDRTARVWDLSDPSNPIILEGHGGTVQYGHFEGAGQFCKNR